MHQKHDLVPGQGGSHAAPATKYSSREVLTVEEQPRLTLVPLAGRDGLYQYLGKLAEVFYGGGPANIADDFAGHLCGDGAEERLSVATSLGLWHLELVGHQIPASGLSGPGVERRFVGIPHGRAGLQGLAQPKGEDAPLLVELHDVGAFRVVNHVGSTVRDDCALVELPERAECASHSVLDINLRNAFCESEMRPLTQQQWIQ